MVPRNYWARHVRTAKHQENLKKPQLAVTEQAKELAAQLDKLCKYKNKVKDYLQKIKKLETGLGYSQSSSKTESSSAV